MKTKKRSFMFLVIAMLCGAIAGSSTTSSSEVLGVPLLRLYGLIGSLFINALSLVLAPLVASSILIGVARIAEDEDRQIGRRAARWFFLTTFFAVATGALVAFFLFDDPAQKATITALSDSEATTPFFDAFEMITSRLIPNNLFAAISSGNILGLIGFSFSCGLLLQKLDTASRQMLLSLAHALFELMVTLARAILRFLPLGVFGLLARAVAMTGSGAIQQVAQFFVVESLSLLLFGGGCLSFLLFMNGIHPGRHLQKMAPALATAFAASSTMAALPITRQCLERYQHLSSQKMSLLLPLAATTNLSATALYITIAVLFVAHMDGVTLTIPYVSSVGALAFISSLGIAGVPTASMLSVIAITTAMGLSHEPIALLFAVERILDMARSAINAYTNSCSVLLTLQGAPATVHETTSPPSLLSEIYPPTTLSHKAT